MNFASPLWLLGLLPWLAVVIWLLMGRRLRAQVPFLHLWKGPTAAPPKARAAMTLPPWPIMLALLALLLAILGAARPKMTFIARGEHPLITIIFDRGLTMSGLTSDQHQPQWKSLVEQLKQTLDSRFGSGPVDLFLVPDGKTIHSTSASWADLALSQESAPVDTGPLLHQLIARQNNSPLLVITNQDLKSSGDRIIQIAPQDRPRNVGIITASVAASPRPQVMVRVRNDSLPGKAALKISSAGHDASADIDLPPPGSEQNYFVDLDALDANVSIELISDVPDDLAADNHAALVLQHSPPSIESHGDLPPEVARIIATYMRLRPSSAGSTRILVSADPVDATYSAVIVATSSTRHSGGIPRVIDHPVNAHVDWPSILKNEVRTAATSAPGDGWQNIVSLDDQPLVAVRESPVRQVWIGFDSDLFPRTSDFVVFWTNIFDWLGQSGEQTYLFHGATAVAMPERVQNDWQKQIRSLPVSRRSGLDVTEPLLIAALIALLAATTGWAGIFTSRRPSTIIYAEAKHTGGVRD